MREGLGNTIAETRLFGYRNHGIVRDTTLTLPSGNSVSDVLSGENNVIVSGVTAPWGFAVHDQQNDVYIKNYAVLSWPDAISGIGPRIYGKNPPFAGLPFVAPSKRVWWVGHVDSDASYVCSDATWQAKCERFGLIKDGATSDTHVVMFANPVFGAATLNSKVARLWDCSPDGAHRIYKIGSGQYAFAWLEVVVAEADETHLTVVASVVRSMAQTLGSYVDNAPAITPGGPLGSSFVFAPRGTSTGSMPNISFEYLPWESRVFYNGSWYNDGSVQMAYSKSYNATLTGYIASLNYTASGALSELLLDVSMTYQEVEDAPVASGTGGQKAQWLVSDTGGGQFVTTGPTFSASATLSHTATINAGIVYTLRRDQQSSSHRSQVSITKTRTESVNYTQAPNPTALPTYTANFDSALSVSSLTQADMVFVLDGATLAPMQYSSAYNDTQDVDFAAISVGSALPRVGGASVGPVPGNFWAAPPADRWQLLLDSTMMCEGNFSYLSTVEGHRMFSRVDFRTNSLWSAYGAVVPWGGTMVTAAYEWALVGRNGPVPGPGAAVVASYNASATPPVSWQSIYVSEQPATGEVARGTTSQRVGFV